MEPHEENKLMREVLEAIIESSPHTSISIRLAREVLYAISTAAQPKESDVSAARRKADWYELRELFNQIGLVPAAHVAIFNSLYPWHRSKLTEAHQDAVNAALEADEQRRRAEKAEAEATRCAKEWADAVVQRQLAPQAGDALSSIDTFDFTALLCDWGRHYKASSSDTAMLDKAKHLLIAHIDASRREAYDKGRAEGFERGMKQRLMARVEAALAAPPASAASASKPEDAS